MEQKGLELGKIYHAGNFIIKKFTRTLTKKQVLQLRDAMNIPRDVQKRLERNGMQFIKHQPLVAHGALNGYLECHSFKQLTKCQ